MFFLFYFKGIFTHACYFAISNRLLLYCAIFTCYFVRIKIFQIPFQSISYTIYNWNVRKCQNPEMGPCPTASWWLAFLKCMFLLTLFPPAHTLEPPQLPRVLRQCVFVSLDTGRDVVRRRGWCGTRLGKLIFVKYLCVLLYHRRSLDSSHSMRDMTHSRK